jgi:hypothetical protein
MLQRSNVVVEIPNIKIHPRERNRESIIAVTELSQSVTL